MRWEHADESTKEIGYSQLSLRSTIATNLTTFKNNSKKLTLKKPCFSRKMIFPIFTDHITYSVVYTKNTAFGPFRRPDGISESRNSPPLSKSVAPIRLNLVPPKPDCPPYQQTEHIPCISDGILVQQQTNRKASVLFTCFIPVFFAV